MLWISHYQSEMARKCCALFFLGVTSLFPGLFCFFPRLFLSQLYKYRSLILIFLWELLHLLGQHLPSFPESLSLRTLVVFFAVIPADLPGTGSRHNDL